MKTAQERAIDIVYGGLRRGVFKDDEQLVEAIEHAIKAHSQAGYSIREQIEKRLFGMGFDTTNVMLTLPLQAVWTAVEGVELALFGHFVKHDPPNDSFCPNCGGALWDCRCQDKSWFTEGLTNEHPPTSPR